MAIKILSKIRGAFFKEHTPAKISQTAGGKIGSERLAEIASMFGMSEPGMKLLLQKNANHISYLCSVPGRKSNKVAYTCAKRNRIVPTTVALVPKVILSGNVADVQSYAKRKAEETGNYLEQLKREPRSDVAKAFIADEADKKRYFKMVANDKTEANKLIKLTRKMRAVGCAEPRSGE